MYLPQTHHCQPQGLRACCPGRLYMKNTSPKKAGREMYLYLSGWCHPCMQNCRTQLDCRREKEREAQDRTHVYFLQDETARKDKAGIQSSIHRCRFKSQKSQPRAQQHWFPHHGTHQAGPRSSRMAKSHCATQPPPRSLPWVASWLHCASTSSLPWL